MNFKPYRYQKDGAIAIENFGGRALLADEMGLGKSVTALLWARRNPEARPAVIVCPKSVKWHWERECREKFGWPARVLSGTAGPAAEPLEGPEEFLIINYDILHCWLGGLKELKPQLVVVDEAHYCKGHRTRRTKAVRELCQGVPHVLALSGTPLVNRPAELWPTLNLLRPERFPNFFSYAHKFCDARHTIWGWKYDGASNLGQLHRLLVQACMIRRRKADVLGELPEKRRLVVPVELEDGGQYRQAESDFVAWLLEHKPTRACSALRAEQVTRLTYLKQLAGWLKLRAVEDWVDDFLAESDGKLLVYAVHRQVIARLAERYGNACVRVDGSTPGRARQEAVDRFQNDPAVRVFVGNIQAAGTGITLTAAETGVFAEMGWTPGEHEQAEARNHRIGTRGAVTWHWLVAKDTIEMRLAEVLQGKAAVLSAALDGGTREGDLDVYELLTEELIKNER